MVVKFCLFGPSRSGKTTLSNYLVEKYGFELIKISRPLHEFQTHLYTKLGLFPDGQDGELLQFLANKIEKISPGSLGKLFLDRLHNSSSNLIVNDDCRYNSYRFLEKEGFVFIKIVTNENNRNKRERVDITQSNPLDSVELDFEKFKIDEIVDNNNDIEKSFSQLDAIILKYRVLYINPNN